MENKDLDIEKKMDEKLEKLLQPVSPNSTFIANLQEKLVSRANVSIEYPNYLLIIIILGSGLAVGLILVIFINRIIRTLTGKNRK
ncbi:MAG: hypothetical protein HPY72_02435 [Anaerolineae bacterium]|nr:hypothetical protein [Anaerolineae bacterium]